MVSKGPNFDLAAIQQAVLSDLAVQLVAPPSDNSLWITTGADGPILVIAIDPTPVATSAPQRGDPALSLPGQPALNQLAAEVPGSRAFRVYMGLGNRFTDPTSDLAAMLAANGYTSAGTGAATVAELRTVKDAGVLFIKTHGARLFTEKTGLPYYALYTATPYPMPAETKQDNDDVLTRRLTIFDAINRNTWPWTADTAEERHYAITPLFVSEYMTMAPNGFVMINACLSSAYPWLRDAFFAKGASLFAGWDSFVDGVASDQTARYVIDRMLGANKFKPESPPQHAFDSASLGPDLVAKGLDHTALPSYGTAHLGFPAGRWPSTCTCVLTYSLRGTSPGRFPKKAPNLSCSPTARRVTTRAAGSTTTRMGASPGPGPAISGSPARARFLGTCSWFPVGSTRNSTSSTWGSTWRPPLA